MKEILTIFLISCTSLIWGQNLNPALVEKADIVVATDGSGNFTSISEAIKSISKNKATRTIIYVKNGIYTEKLEVESGINKVTLIGENIDSTKLVYNDYAGNGKKYNGIISSKIGDDIGTSTSHTLYIDSDDFILMNMTIVNSAGDVGQGVAVNLGGDRTILVHCRILGNQDTFYTWGTGRFYMKDCFIEGAVDFIFGRGAALFDSCIINSNHSSSPITAASTDAGWKFGYVFQNSKITANYGISGCPLGRPWKEYAHTVFMNCSLGKHIIPAGWSEWSGNTNHTTCFYAEYNNFGPGSSTKSRVSWSSQLSDSEAQEYTMANIFSKNVNPSAFSNNWIPAIEEDEIYTILKANTGLLYLDSLQNNADLKYIKINGIEIDKFDPLKKSYTLELTDTLSSNRVISVEPFSDKASVTIKEPTEIPGYATITVTAINGYSQKYSLKYVLRTTIKRIALDGFDIEVLSNPFDETLTIKAVNKLKFEPLEISLYNLSGKIVLFKKLETVDDELINLQTNHLSSGVYICKVQQGNRSQQLRVIKK